MLPKDRLGGVAYQKRSQRADVINLNIALRWRAAPRIEEQLVEVAEAGRGADSHESVLVEQGSEVSAREGRVRWSPAFSAIRLTTLRSACRSTD